MSLETKILPTGHSLETPESNLSEKIHIIFHAGTLTYRIILSKEDAQQLAEDILEYGA